MARQELFESGIDTVVGHFFDGDQHMLEVMAVRFCQPLKHPEVSTFQVNASNEYVLGSIFHARENLPHLLEPPARILIVRPLFPKGT